MGFDLVDKVVAVVEGDDAGVVVEYRHEPGASLTLAGGAIDGLRRAADERLEQRADRLRLFPRLAVGDGRVEDLVLAVLAPRLGDALELDVGRRRTEPGRGAPGVFRREAEVVTHRLHLGERQREELGLRECDEGIVRSRKIDGGDIWGGVRRDLRHGEIDGTVAPFVVVVDPNRLDHRVREKLRRDPTGLLGIDAFQEVHRRRVDGGVGGELPAERVLDADSGGFPHGVRNARLVGDGDGEVERSVVEAPQRAVLGHRIDELVQHAAGVVVRQVGLDPVHVPRADAGDRDAEEGAHGRGDGRPARVRKGRAGRDFESVHHGKGLRNVHGSRAEGIEQDDCIDVRHRRNRYNR